MKALEPLMFEKGVQLKDRWTAMMHEDADGKKSSATIDVCHWLSRAAFDVVGLSGAVSLLTYCRNVQGVYGCVTRFRLEF